MGEGPAECAARCCASARSAAYGRFRAVAFACRTTNDRYFSCFLDFENLEIKSCLFLACFLSSAMRYCGSCVRVTNSAIVCIVGFVDFALVLQSFLFSEVRCQPHSMYDTGPIS